MSTAIEKALTTEGGQTAIIVPEAMEATLRTALADCEVDFGSPDGQGMTKKLVVLTPTAAKGLEFDHVIVLEPRLIAGRTRRGLRLLFVALTRSTKQLTVVHADPLPKALNAPHVPEGSISANGRSEPPDDSQTGDLSDLKEEAVVPDVPPLEDPSELPVNVPLNMEQAEQGSQSRQSLVRRALARLGR